MPGLGRLKSPDPRDLRFQMRAHLPPAPIRRVQVWRHGPILDQGSTPRCTAFAWRGFLNAWPGAADPAAPPDTATFYAAEQAVDGFQHISLPDDTDATGGSSVRAGAKVLASAGLITEYVWCADTATLAAWVLDHGPAVMGVDWWSDMFDPDRRGFVRPNGSIVGGHAFLCLGHSRVSGTFLFQNSWGNGWSTHGLFRMSAADVQKLLDDEGECCAAVETRRV